jgi:uncharacterized RDD family membrane protein YckC
MSDETTDDWGARFTYAGFWHRLPAAALDLVILFGAMLMFDIAFIALMGLPWTAAFTYVRTGDALKTTYQASYHPTTVAKVVWFGLSVLYLAAFETSAAMATPGKRVMKLIVVRDDGFRLRRAHAAWRSILKLLPIALLLFTYSPKSLLLAPVFLMAGWTAQRQACTTSCRAPSS